MKSMRCPRDQAVLVPGKLKNDLAKKKNGNEWIDVFECPTCQGILFDIKKMEEAVGETAPLFQLQDIHPLTKERAASQKLGCSLCNNKMNPIIVFGVELDICESCKALWFDPGELQKVHRRYKAKYGGMGTNAHESETYSIDEGMGSQLIGGWVSMNIIDALFDLFSSKN